MLKFEELPDRQQHRKLKELERYAVDLIADDFRFIVWSDGHSKLPAATLNSRPPTNSIDRIGE